MAPWVRIPPPPPDMLTEVEIVETSPCEGEESGCESRRSPQVYNKIMEQWEKNKQIAEEVDKMFEESDKIVHAIMRRIAQIALENSIEK